MGIIMGDVDEEVHLVHKPDGEGVAQEGEKEEHEECDILQGHHELPMGAIDRVVERFLDAVCAADDCGQAGAQEDGCGGHQGRAHDRISECLDG